MNKIETLLATLAQQEQALTQQPFMAPCILGGLIRVKLSGLVCTLKPQPTSYEGWGIFSALETRAAQYLRPAKPAQIDRYLEACPALRLRLTIALKGKSWLAYPIQEADMRQRFGQVKPVVVRLVTGGRKFEPIVARWDGMSWWYQGRDRSASNQQTRQLRQALRQEIWPETLTFAGLTPEMRTVYRLVCRSMPHFAPRCRDERRLRAALRQGGGDLEHFTDHGKYWTVQWTTSEGVPHSSAIAKADLMVIGAGICLSGLDSDFDLQSLVGVVERQ